MLTIDPSTGALVWQQFVIHPAMTEEDLLHIESESLKLGGAYQSGEVTHSHYTIAGVPVRADQTATATVYFANRGLTQVTLAFGIADEGDDWSDWSEAREWQRQRLHEAFLDRVFGQPDEVMSLATSHLEEKPFSHRRYVRAWGDVGSSFDGKTGFAEIYIRYG